MIRRILIAGIGNRLRRDDGFGPRVIEELSKIRLPNNIELRDYGTNSLNLLFQMDEYDEVILIDIVDKGGKPGQIYIIKPEIKSLKERNAQKIMMFSLHELRLEDTLALSKTLGIMSKDVLIIGCQPTDLSFGLDLSKNVKKAIKKVIRIILEHIK